MSDTSKAEKPFRIERSKRPIMGEGDTPVETAIAHFGNGRTVEVRKLEADLQWDVLEHAGNSGSINQLWFAWASTAAAVVAVDGVPVNPESFSRDAIRPLIRRLGTDGMNAAIAATGELDPAKPAPGVDPEAAHRAQVGNSAEAQASGT